MSDPSLELQGAMAAALKGVSPQIAGARIYDNVPDKPLFPYVTIGDCQVLPDKAFCIDGAEVYPVIDVWSRLPGYPETKGIVKQILAVLDDQPISIPGFKAVVFQVNRIDYLRDPDGLTRHGSITFHGFINPA